MDTLLPIERLFPWQLREFQKVSSGHYTVSGVYDFNIEPQAIISDQARFEAIRLSSQKAIDVFIAQVAAQGSQTSKGVTMTINQIVRNTVERLKAEGKVWTPDVYAQTFCMEAKKAGVQVEDCSGIERFTPLLDKKTLDEVKLYRVKTTAELIRFLISKMSRMNPTEASVLVELLSSLAQAMAQSIDILHNPDASASGKKNHYDFRNPRG